MSDILTSTFINNFILIFVAIDPFALIPIFAGIAVLGGSMFRDFTIVATAMSADISKIKQAGIAGIISLFVGITITFFTGALIAFLMGYSDVVSITTIGAGACTYIVGPVTGTALGASSEVIAISVATGVVKTIFTTIILLGSLGVKNIQYIKINQK